jgi:hypothetical protein
MNHITIKSNAVEHTITFHNKNKIDNVVDISGSNINEWAAVVSEWFSRGFKDQPNLKQR